MSTRSSARLKVLFVSGIFPPDIGGPATYVPAMAAALLRRGHEVAVATLSENVENAGDAYPYPVLRIPRNLTKPWRFLRTVVALVRHGWHSDVLFVHGLFPEAVVANFVLRKPQVQKWVGDWAWERSTNKGWTQCSFAEFQRGWHGLRAEWLKLIRSFCARQADAVIVPSRYLGTTLVQWGVTQERIEPIYNAVDTNSVLSVTVPLATRFKLVTVGRLIALKQVDRILRLIEKRNDLGLVIVGDGPERGRLEALARSHGTAERIYFAGQKNHHETLALMAGCDVFVLNSTHEGFPHVLLEAMSLGLPVVATAVGGTPELVSDGENGVLISPASESDLRRAIERLIASPAERARFAEAGKRTVARFGHGTAIDHTEAVLMRAWEKTSLAGRGAPEFGHQARP